AHRAQDAAVRAPRRDDPAAHGGDLHGVRDAARIPGAVGGPAARRGVAAPRLRRPGPGGGAQDPGPDRGHRPAAGRAHKAGADPETAHAADGGFMMATTAEIRAWAAANGYPELAGGRGQIGQDVREQYDAAHQAADDYGAGTGPDDFGGGPDPGYVAA